MALMWLAWASLAIGAAAAESGGSDVISLVDKFGVVGLLLLSVLAFLREDIVPGRRYRRMEADRDEWRARCLNAMRGWEELASATEMAVAETPSPPKGRSRRVPQT